MLPPIEIPTGVSETEEEREERGGRVGAGMKEAEEMVVVVVEEIPKRHPPAPYNSSKQH